MDSILEKITFYDLYGYTFPGCLLLLLCKGQWILQKFQASGGLYKDVYIYLFIIFVFSGFLLGIMITEISEWIFLKILKPYRTKYLSPENTGISYNQVEKALKETGILEDGKSITEQNFSTYGWYIYSVIQSEPSFKRIHNYSSSEMLYKNMAAVGGIVACRILIEIPRGNFHMVSFFISILFIAVFLRRAIRFSEKKEVYALYWFLKMQNENKTKTLENTVTN